MNAERYLLGIAAALRDDVLPTLPPSPARDQVINSLRVLTRVAIGLERSTAEAQAAADDARLPADLRAAFVPTGTSAEAPLLAEEISVDAATLRGMTAASTWLATKPWGDDPAQRDVALALLERERQWRGARLARMAAAEHPVPPAASTTVSGSNLTEDTLLAWLQKKLDNPQLRIDSYRLLPGGRTRKTVMFRQTGQADWPEWLVIQCDPPVGYHIFPGAISQYPVLEYLHRSGKIRSPQPILLELDPSAFGNPFMIVGRMAGSPPSQGINFFAPPPKSEKLALDLARQMAALHSLPIASVEKQVPVMLPASSGEYAGWRGDLEKLMAAIAAKTHGPSLTLSAAFAWMRRNAHCVTSRRTLVHGDMLQQNLLTDGETLTGILDWEAVRIGHPGEDLGYVRPMIEQMTSWEKFMAAYHEAGGPAFSPAEGDYFALRAYILMLTLIADSRTMFEIGKVDDIRAAEVGCSLAPLFVNCVAEILEKVLQREAAQ